VRSGTTIRVNELLSPGDMFGAYRIEATIGQGAMGIVYGAIRADSGSDDQVALKVLRRELATDGEYRERFRREARAASTVAHPHLVPVLEAGEVGGVAFVAMPLVDGRALEEVIHRDGPLTPGQVARVAREIGGALDALHAVGLMHRDVKPANVLVTRDGGSSMLTDFGLAKGTAGYQTVTAPGGVAGTLEYVAPERIRGERATPASDLYSLGCTLFECVAGSPPFPGANQMTILMGHLQEEAPNPSWQRAGLDERFGEAVVAALAKDPDARPRSGAEYAGLLARAATR
jgi:serine/threonine protein kinase